MRIGLISDTHQPSDRKSLWDEVYTAFEGVDLILHAGDITHSMVLDWLEEIAPVVAAQGNNDFGLVDPRITETQWLDVAGRRIAMVHDMEPEHRELDYLRRIYLTNQPADIIVTGHTHIERIDWREGVLQINPGSATLPRIVRLGETEGRPNPGIEWSFTPDTGVTRPS